ncbi:MAG: hypothetical protein AUF79_14145 [Crenarchaeota archaeon 13_1_20CM_2_51_8]|nr:MAG: hypothetical protein AUF79_14145 [Crenarchaeota archaeon 13_1_20CM_2_51_8]
MRITPINFSQNLLFAVTKSPIAQVLDQARTVGNVEQTVSMLCQATKLDFETVECAIKQMTRLELAYPTGKIGNMQAYKFNLEKGHQSLVGLTGQLQQGKQFQR